MKLDVTMSSQHCSSLGCRHTEQIAAVVFQCFSDFIDLANLTHQHFQFDLADTLLAAVAKSKAGVAEKSLFQLVADVHHVFCTLVIVVSKCDVCICLFVIHLPVSIHPLCTTGECLHCIFLYLNANIHLLFEPPTCVQASLHVLQGSVWSDCLYGCCCYPLSWLQISRELKRRAASHASSSSSSARYTALIAPQGAHLV